MKIFKLNTAIILTGVFLQSASAQKPISNDKDILLLSTAMEKGINYSSLFIHPFTGDTLHRYFKKNNDSTFSYVEEMPNGGKMTCQYNRETTENIAKYYKSLSQASSVSTEAHINLGSDENGKPTSETTAIYKINGKKVDNPIAECLTNGDCKIEGYGNTEAHIETAPGVTVESK